MLGEDSWSLSAAIFEKYDDETRYEKLSGKYKINSPKLQSMDQAQGVVLLSVRVENTSMNEYRTMLTLADLAEVGKE